MALAGALLLGLPLLTPDVGRPAEPGSSTTMATGAESLFGDEDPRGAHLAPGNPEERSKKEQWLVEKATRPNVHVTDAMIVRSRKAARVVTTKGKVATHPPLTGAIAPSSIGVRLEPVTTLFNLRTREALALIPGLSHEERFHRFLRDHYTNQATEMDTRLIDVLAQVARRFEAARIEVVSGYRSPKYNLMLLKKGHEVARQSQHTEGNAVDFRVRGVPTKVLLKFVKSLRRGGVGYYPHSQFVHSDTGKIRFWTGS